MGDLLVLEISFIYFHWKIYVKRLANYINKW